MFAPNHIKNLAGVSMFTPDSLLELAIGYLAMPGDSEAVYRAKKTADTAILASRWMERKGVVEMVSIGPFASWIPVNGDKVRIKAGAEIRSTLKKNDRVTTRPYTVMVSRVGGGYINEDRDGILVQNFEVVWAGSGGYWCRTDLSNVEIVT